MLCIAAFIVLAVLGVFSATYRDLAREAFDCMRDRARREPCESGFDQKMKTAVTARLMRWPRLARIWRRHADLIAALFLLLVLASLAIAAEGMYNLAVHGACTPSDPASCTFTPGNTTG